MAKVKIDSDKPRVLTTMERARGREEYYGTGGYGKSKAFLNEMLPKSICVFSPRIFQAGVQYGVIIGPTVLHTDQSTTGADVAIWVAPVSKSRKGAISPAGRPLKDKGTGKYKWFWQHIKISWDSAWGVAEAIQTLMKRSDVLTERAKTVGLPAGVIARIDTTCLPVISQPEDRIVVTPTITPTVSPTPVVSAGGEMPLPTGNPGDVLYQGKWISPEEHKVVKIAALKAELLKVEGLPTKPPSPESPKAENPNKYGLPRATTAVAEGAISLDTVFKSPKSPGALPDREDAEAKKKAAEEAHIRKLLDIIRGTK